MHSDIEQSDRITPIKFYTSGVKPTMVVLACMLPYSFIHPCFKIGKLGSVIRSRRHPLILRFFPLSLG